MKRIILFTLVLVLALSLCACRDRKGAEQTAAETTAAPTPVPTPELTPAPAEAVRASMEALQTLESEHASTEIEFEATVRLNGDESPEGQHVKAAVQVETDYTASPYIMKGTLTFALYASYESGPTEIPFCVWNQDGKTCYAIRYGGMDKWIGSTFENSGLGLLQNTLGDYHTFLSDWAEQFTLVGEDTVNGEPATVYEAVFEGEALRKLVEMYTVGDSEPLITFTDELLSELPGVRHRVAIDANGRPVYQEIDVAAFLGKLLERLLPENDFHIDKLQIKGTLSDFNAVGPLEIPEEVVLEDYSTALSSLAGQLAN